MNPIRLLLVDDHILFREGLARLLASEPDFFLVGDCSSSTEALEIITKEPIDLLLLDFDLGDDHGNSLISAARTAGYKGKILMVTAGMDTVEASTALSLGASGIFHKHNAPASLTRAIRLIASGELWVDEKLIRTLAGQSAKREDNVRRNFTEREQTVLRGLFEGASNKELATALGVSESAVKATLQQLFHKTGVRTRSQLVRIALETSLTTGPSS